jgi:hypothetical protein
MNGSRHCAEDTSIDDRRPSPAFWFRPFAFGIVVFELGLHCAGNVRSRYDAEPQTTPLISAEERKMVGDRITIHPKPAHARPASLGILSFTDILKSIGRSPEPA